MSAAVCDRKWEGNRAISKNSNKMLLHCNTLLNERDFKLNWMSFDLNGGTNIQSRKQIDFFLQMIQWYHQGGSKGNYWPERLKQRDWFGKNDNKIIHCLGRKTIRGPLCYKKTVYPLWCFGKNIQKNTCRYKKTVNPACAWWRKNSKGSLC